MNTTYIPEIERLADLGPASLYSVDLTQAGEPSDLRVHLPEDEYASIRHSNPEGQRRRVLARVAQRAILQEAAGEWSSLAEIPIEREQRGRPFLRNGPAFSVTNTGQNPTVDDIMYVAVAKNPDAQLGLDAEYESREIKHLKIYDEESRRWASDSRRRLQYWTWCEAASKIEGHGIVAFPHLRFTPPSAHGERSTFSQLDCPPRGITSLAGHFQERKHKGRALTLAWS